MRVGLDARWHNPFGVGSYVAELLSAFAGMESGLELVVYESREKPLPDHLRIANARFVAIGSGRYSLSGQVELVHRASADRLDVFHSPFYITPVAAGCPVVATVHDLIPFLFKTYSGPHRQLVKFGYRLCAWKCARFIVPSTSTAADLTRILRVSPARVSVVTWSYPRSLFHETPTEGELAYLERKYGVRRPYALVQGADNWRTKNIETALRAVALVRKQQARTLQAVLVGPGTHIDELVAKNPELANGLVRTGYIAEDDLPKFYRQASAFVIASKYEGFGFPLLYAMACGCPAVSSTAGSLTELAADAALLSGPDDAAKMAEHIGALLASDTLAEEMRSRGLKRAQDFNREKLAAMTLEIGRAHV